MPVGTAARCRGKGLETPALPTASALDPGLYLVATPIGHLGDFSRRGVDVLKRADRIVCEDTRVTRTLLRAYGIKRRLEIYHDHSRQRRRQQLLLELAAGRSLALVSDAGTPLVSDPGFKLVRAARLAGHRVTAVPGACAAITALQLSGLACARFTFLGFLPPRLGEKKRLLETFAALPTTLIIYESAQRLAATLKTAHAVFGDRKAVIARELTKLYEEVVPFCLADGHGSWLPTRGEITLLIAGAPEGLGQDAQEISKLLEEALAQMSLRAAVTQVAAASGQPRREIYRQALNLQEQRQNGSPLEDHDHPQPPSPRSPSPRPPSGEENPT